MTKEVQEVKKEGVKIRRLQQRDRKTVTKMFEKAIKSLGRSDLFNMISSVESETKNNKDSEEEVGAQIVKIALDLLVSSIDILDNDMGIWFADLIGVKFEDFGDQPFTIEIDIIDQLGASQDAADFFTRCFRHAKKTAWLDNLLSKAKTMFDSFMDEQKKNLEGSTTQA